LPGFQPENSRPTLALSAMQGPKVSWISQYS
jgi:hypothetical protein